jgi:hypothetical protein
MSDRDYEVGYGKPPTATRFKRGVSGNPKGRPKGSRNLASDLADELDERIVVRESGKQRRVSKQRGWIKSLMAKALQGNVQASVALLALYGRLLADPPEDQASPIDDAELQILRRFAPRLLAAVKKK